MELKNKKIAFLGDSITEGCCIENPDSVYWKQFGFNDGCKVYGYGISGTRISRSQRPSKNPRNDLYFKSRLPEMIDDADLVVVFGGTNDCGHGDAPIGTMEDRTDDTFYGAIHNLITALQEKYPKAQLVFMTPSRRDEEPWEYIDAEGNKTPRYLPDYVAIIKEVVTSRGIPVFDLYQAWDFHPEISENVKRYIPDGLHPSDEGHQEIYRHLKRFLEAL